ncbi:MAG: tryptophan-rich sensory protein [Aureispira sp.]|nr:tryptophan-rich sensory protein [Aureispira sp.]
MKVFIVTIACLLTVFIGSYATASSVSSWYLTLNKPSFNPPSWLFGPVWTLLYISMGIAAYYFWNAAEEQNSPWLKWGLSIFFAQLVLNALWSVLFFGTQTLGLAFIEIIIMWVAILGTIIIFAKVLPWTGYILIPYLCWVSFASLLNGSIWWLNS